MMSKNRYSNVDFEGFSPNDMYGLLYSTFDEKKSPLRLAKEIDEELISNVVFNNHIIEYLLKLKEEEPLKLTQKGNLPRKFCREFLQATLTDDSSKAFMEQYPVMKEEDSYYMRIINILTEFAGYTKKVRGKKSLTKKCHDFLAFKSSYPIYREILLVFIRKFNWGYLDYCPESPIIQQSFGFSLFLAQKYGDKQKNVKFYSDKFLRAFPEIIEEFSDIPYLTKKGLYEKCYYIRVFDRFLERFGLVEIEKSGKFPSEEQFIMKKDLLDSLIKWQF